jgi:hypothetical protein
MHLKNLSLLKCGSIVGSRKFTAQTVLQWINFNQQNLRYRHLSRVRGGKNDFLTHTLHENALQAPFCTVLTSMSIVDTKSLQPKQSFNGLISMSRTKDTGIWVGWEWKNRKKRLSHTYIEKRGTSSTSLYLKAWQLLTWESLQPRQSFNGSIMTSRTKVTGIWVGWESKNTKSDFLKHKSHVLLTLRAFCSCIDQKEESLEMGTDNWSVAIWWAEAKIWMNQGSLLCCCCCGMIRAVCSAWSFNSSFARGSPKWVKCVTVAKD